MDKTPKDHCRLCHLVIVQTQNVEVRILERLLGQYTVPKHSLGTLKKVQGKTLNVNKFYMLNKKCVAFSISVKHESR